MCASPAGGAVFVWDDAGADFDWDTCGNWQSIGGGGGPCYPVNCKDDAVISDCDSSPCDVNLIDRRIDDLTIAIDVAFDAVSGEEDGLLVDTLTIAGPAEVTATAEARIRATGVCP